MFPLLTVFIIAFIGYLLGSIKIAGIKLGTAGALLAALVFGHFGFSVPALVRDLGLALFVGAVGLIAGPIFFRGFKKQAVAYIAIGLVIIAAGMAITVAAITVFKIPTSLAAGVMAGSLTSTPGLAAAIEATGSDLASVGYGIAYPFGVVGVVLFVQLIPKFGRFDIVAETDALIQRYTALQEAGRAKDRAFKILDRSGMLPLTASIAIGLLIGQIVIPLPGGASFSLGTAGGPLLSGLVFGHFGRFGGVSIEVPPKTLEILREFGLVFFLIGAGTGAGSGFIAIVREYGISLFIIGAVISLFSMIIGYIMVSRIFKLPLLDGLGSICGGMTSTPALGTLIGITGTEHVAAAYAATYPVALICVVLACQIIALVM